MTSAGGGDCFELLTRKGPYSRYVFHLRTKLTSPQKSFMGPLMSNEWQGKSIIIQLYFCVFHFSTLEKQTQWT